MLSQVPEEKASLLPEGGPLPEGGLLPVELGAPLPENATFQHRRNGGETNAENAGETHAGKDEKKAEHADSHAGEATPGQDEKPAEGERERAEEKAGPVEEKGGKVEVLLSVRPGQLEETQPVNMGGQCCTTKTGEKPCAVQ